MKKWAKWKRVLAMLLSLVMVLGLMPDLGGGSTGQVFAEAGTITRAQWLSELTKLFEMTVEEDNYPDNYFSDLSEDSPYYYDILLAVEFGVVDIEAGKPCYPEAVVTREFAVHTLNYCLGFQLDEGAQYTFSDAEAVTYPADAQIGVNRGWVSLSDGKFLPEEPLTAAEKTAMFADAKDVLASTKIDENHENTYVFEEDVVVIPDGTTVMREEGNLIEIYECPKTIGAGERFAVYIQGLPEVYTAKTVKTEGGWTIIEVEAVEGSEGISSAEAEGIVDCDLTQVEPAEGVDITYIEGGTEELAYADGIEHRSVEAARAAGSKKIKSVKIGKTFALADGARVRVEWNVSNISVNYKVSLLGREAYVAVNGVSTTTATLSANAVAASGLPGSFTLLSIPVGGVGEIAVNAEYSLSGQVSMTYSANFSAGVHYTSKNGFRLETNFNKKQFHIAAEAKLSVGIKASLGVTKLPVISGAVYACAGISCTYTAHSYHDEKAPQLCEHICAWLYADAGAYATVDFGVFRKSFSKSISIFTISNSPVRFAAHYEDHHRVQYCTRNRNGYYYSRYDSRYGSDGMRYGYSEGGDGSGGIEVPTWTYSLAEDEFGNQLATITGYNGNAASLIIPSTLDGYSVVEIGSNVFKGKTSLYSVVIPEGVTSINGSAFANCSNLSNVVLPRSLTYLGSESFGNCDSLTTIEIPKKLERVGASSNYSGPFAYCDNLKSVTFEEGTTQVVEGLFSRCSGIEKMVLPDTITSIGNYAFFGCENLKEVQLSKNLTSIDHSAFRNCSNLSNVVLPKSLTYLGSESFGNCDSLTTIEIPKKLERVGASSNYSGPFAYCDNLKSVTFEEGTTQVVGGLFGRCSGIEKMVLPDTITSIGNYAFFGCENLKEVQLSKNLTSIDHSAFRNCSNLSNVVLPKSLTYLGSESFGNCDSLTTIEIPKKLERVGASSNYSGPFAYCDNLKSVTFEEGTTQVVEGLFGRCNGIEKMVLLDTITSIGDRAFWGCENLKEVQLSKNLTSIGPSAFRNCTSLEAITIPDKVESIGNSAFSGCSSLKKVKLPKGRQNITEGMFQNCASLETIELPETVTYIRASAFAGSGLKSTKLPKKLELIEESAFRDCEALESIEIPDSVTSIGNSIFYNCTSLSKVALGSGITAIPANAFYQCQKLTEIKLPYRISTVGSSAFANCTGLTSVTVPRGVTSIADNAFSYPEKLTMYGISGTYGEEYAKAHGIAFVNKEVKATGVTLSEKEVTIIRGKTSPVIMTITPADFTDEVTWKSSDTDVATVNDMGVITAKGVGTATIKVVVGNLSASCTVTVVQPVTGINLNETSLSMEALDTYQLKATAKPDNAANREISWSSSDEKVAVVDGNGLVTAIGKGTAQITATAKDGSGITRTCDVTVINNAVAAKTVAEMESPHPYANDCQDAWIYTIENAKNLAVTFHESTEMEDGFDYLYVYDEKNNEVGKYTGKELAGKTIQVPGSLVKLKIVSDKAGNTYGFKVADIQAVQQGEVKVTDISLNETQIEMKVQDTYQLTATVSPSNAANQKIRWSSSDEKVAAVDENGLVTAIGKGTAEITATAEDGSGVSKTCSLTVLEATPNPNPNPNPDPDPVPEWKPGDADGNGSITAEDALAILKHVVGAETLTEAALEGADVDANKQITAEDALAVLKKVVGAIDSFDEIKVNP